MSRINVLVVSTSIDLMAEGIATSVKAHPDMRLVGHEYLLVSEVNAALESLSTTSPIAMVLVGPPSETTPLAERWLAQRTDLVVMHVDFASDPVRVAVRNPSMDSMLAALLGLVEHMGTRGGERAAHIRLVGTEQARRGRPFLRACIAWIHSVLYDAIASVPDDNGDVHGLSIKAKTLLQSLQPVVGAADDQRTETATRDAALEDAFKSEDADDDPLAIARRNFGLSPIEFRILLLTLAPELDLRYQRCFGLLLDDMGRRTGTMTLFHSLLHLTRGEVDTVHLEEWLVFEGYGGRPVPGDEPLRLDAYLTQWLLVDDKALAGDPLVRRVLRLEPWAGPVVLERHQERELATDLIRKLRQRNASRWIILGGEHPAAWRALLELGATKDEVTPIRVESALLGSVELGGVEECAQRLGRLARLSRTPLVVDASTAEAGDDERLRVFCAAVGRTRAHAALICQDHARMIRLLGEMSYELIEQVTISATARVAAARVAARGADAYLSEDAAQSMVNRYPLEFDGLEHAMYLARSRAKQLGADDPALARFMTAAKDVAAESLSNLAERIEPVFDLDEVVLPPDRKEQLIEIVDNVRLAPRVLDEWRFRDQLPYGRGVTALFYGPSGTGKTMAAIGIARRLGIQLLRLDLSRMVSKYIGDTEKHIDWVFNDAHRSGSAILIDEAEALLGKRSEVKDAHDRYANIEVAYLLQRMESYEGLAILTTNMRQNIDPAFLRRLRFIMEFPRPDAAAREQIWRQCLPAESHALDDAAFRQLARKVDLTGGHIRQITLRAAFIAAAAGQQIGLEHIAHAARAEFAKLGMPPVEIDLSQSRRAA